MSEMKLNGSDEYYYRPETTLIVLADTIAKKHGLDPALVCALCEVESSWMPWAVRHEAGYEWLVGFKKAERRDMPVSFMDIKKQWWKPHPKLVRIMPLYSTGLIQIELLAQQTSWGLMQIMGGTARERGFCGWLTELCDPVVNLEWGCKHLRWMLDHPDSYGIPRPGQHGIILVGQEAVNGALAAAWNAGSVRRGDDGELINVNYVRCAVKAMEGYQC